MRRSTAVTALLWMVSVMALRAGVVEGAELSARTPQPSTSGQVHVGEVQLQDEIRIDMSTGAVSRGPTRSSALGAQSTTDGAPDRVYDSMGPAYGVTEFLPTTKWGDLLQMTRGGTLENLTFMATCYPGRTLTTAKLRIRVYDGRVDGTNWPTYPAGTPALLLAIYDTPTLQLNMGGPAGAATQINMTGLSSSPYLPVQVPQNMLLTFEMIEATPAGTSFASFHRAAGVPAAIGSSPATFFVDESGGYAGMYSIPDFGNIALAVDLACPPASLVAPTTLNITIPPGGAGGGSISLANTGCLPLTYSIAAPALMSASPSSGTIPPGGSQGSSITVTPGIVPVGFSGFGDVVVTTNDPVTPSRTVRVNYSVTGSLQRATPGVCYATQGSAGAPPRLYRVNLATGAATPVGPTSGVLVPTMAIEPREGRIYAALPSLLTRVDAATGALASVASISCASALTFSPSGQLVMVGCDSTLYTVDLNTSLRLSVGPVSPHMGGIAFDPTSGLLYGVRKGAGSGTDQLYRIAFPGGTTTLVGALGLGLPIGDITFDEAGNLYGVVGENAAPNQLVSINKTTGLATVIGATGVQGLSTLAYHAPTPNCRFASRVEGFSSQYGPTDYSAQQALGPPNVYPTYGGTQFWMGSLPDAPSEYLHLGFSNPAPINFVTIYETFAPGAIRTIRVKNPDTGLFETVWTGTPAAAPPVSRVFTATFPVTPFPVSEVYLDVASDLVPDFNAIDAVGIGYRDFRTGNQWASSVVGFSSQFSTTAWSAAQAVGAPNLFPLYADAGTAWASATADGQREYLELAYATAAPINFVNVVETFSPGALDKVLVKNPGTGLFEQVWAGTAAPAPAAARMNTVSFPLTQFPVSQVRLEFNSPAVPNWNEIDAVGIGVCDCSATLVDAPLPSAAPIATGIEWARPNPFAVATSIRFSLARAGRVEVDVFDLLGKRVARLVDAPLGGGPHEIRWDGRDAGGRTAPNGVYYLRMKTEGLSDSRKIIKLD